MSSSTRAESSVQAEAAIGRASLEAVAVPLVFILSFGYFVWLAQPDISWANNAQDIGDILWSSKNWGLSHPTGAPLYIALGWVVSRFTDTWQVQAQLQAILLSAMPAALTATVLYFVTRNILAPLLFLACGLIVSQATIVEYYALTGLIILWQWLAKERPVMFGIASFLGILIGHLAGGAFLILLIYRWAHGMSWKWHLPLVLIPALAVYWLYYETAARPPSDVGWIHGTFRSYMFGQGFLLLGLTVWPPASLIERARDVFLIVSVGFGLAILALPYLRGQAWLLGLAVAYFVHYAGNLDPHVYTYLYPFFVLVFLAVGLARLPGAVRGAIAIWCVVMIGWNLYAYDIGRTLDTSPTAARQALTALEAIPDGAVVYVEHGGWIDTLAFLEEKPHDIALNFNIARDPTIKPTWVVDGPVDIPSMRVGFRPVTTCADFDGCDPRP